MANENFTILDGQLISYSGHERSVIVPEGVKVIKEGAFLGCVHIEEVTLPEGVITIKPKAFWGCVGLKHIKLPSTLCTIEFCAFRECESLEEIDVPEGVFFLGDSVFQGCEMLQRAYLPDSLTGLGASTFCDCLHLTDVHLPKKIDTISTGFFRNCVNLRRIEIPENIKTLEENAFLGCTALEDINLPKDLLSIGNTCFEGCRKLIKISVPDTIESIGINAFNKTGLMIFCFSDFLVLGGILVRYMGKDDTAVVPDGVRFIGDHAFACCEELKNVVIPASVTDIHDYAFEHCSILESVTLPAGLKSLGTGVFMDCTALKKLRLPPALNRIGSKLLSNTALEKSNNSDTMILEGKYLIAYTGSADKFLVPDGIQVIADEAFVQCGGVKEITFPYGLRTIGSGAFRWRNELKKISIPSTVTYIGDNAFVNCNEPEITIMNPKGTLCENGFPDGSLLTFVVGSHVLKVRLVWEVKAGDCPERRLWNFVCSRTKEAFEDLQWSDYALPCALCFYETDSWYKDYVTENIVDAVCFAAEEGDYALERVLSFGLLSKDQLQDCINYAIEHKLTQQQMILLRYRQENFGGEGSV